MNEVGTQIAQLWSNSIRPETVVHMMTENELNMLAAYMVDTHGYKAIQYADSAVMELETIGETLRADAWRSLRGVVLDMVEGRRSKAGHSLH